MNKAEVVTELRKRGDSWRETWGEDGYPVAQLAYSLAIAIEQGGGCSWCHGYGECDASDEGTTIRCPHCHGTGISPELAKLLTELGVGE